MLVWLRRSHGWLGIWGAVAGILFGVTTVLMVHSDIFPANEAETGTIQLPVNGTAVDSVDDLGAFVKAELGLLTNWRQPINRAGAGTRSNQPVYITQFTSPQRTLDLRYVDGNEYIEITRTERGLLDTLNRMHRGNGAQLGWTLVGDAFSGALIVLAISGVFLWSRMDGSRLLAIGFGGAGLLAVIYFGMVGA